MAKPIVNNGLPVGIDYRSIKSGDILIIAWKDTEPSAAIVVDNVFKNKPHNYKGYVQFEVFDPRALGWQQFRIEGDQVIKVIKSNILELQLLHVEQDLTQEELTIRLS